MIEIPLNNSPEQIFNITINDIVYDIRVLFNYRQGIWHIDIDSNNECLIAGAAILNGVDILGQYVNVGIKNMYVVNLRDELNEPTEFDLGTESILYILTDEEVSDVETV